jgi:hypothetical protein
MKMLIIGAGKCGLAIMGHFMNQSYEFILTQGSLLQRTCVTGRTLCACLKIKEVLRREWL